MVELNEKALEAAHRAYETYDQAGHLKTQRLSDGHMSAVITAYISALPAPDDGLVERLSQVSDGWAGSFAADVAREAATTLRSQAEQIALIRFQQEVERLTREMDEALDRHSSAVMGEVEATQRADDLEQQVQKLTAENERLEANIARLTSNPVDHRYWEGRYRDEKAEKATALGLLNHLIAWIVHECGAEVPFTDEQDAAFASLETQEGGK